MLPARPQLSCFVLSTVLTNQNCSLTLSGNQFRPPKIFASKALRQKPVEKVVMYAKHKWKKICDQHRENMCKNRSEKTFYEWFMPVILL